MYVRFRCISGFFDYENKPRICDSYLSDLCSIWMIYSEKKERGKRRQASSPPLLFYPPSPEGNEVFLRLSLDGTYVNSEKKERGKRRQASSPPLLFYPPSPSFLSYVRLGRISFEIISSEWLRNVRVGVRISSTPKTSAVC